MSLPVFFHSVLPEPGITIRLQEETARHIRQVLRMPAGANLRLTDGKGKEAQGILAIPPDRKGVDVTIINCRQHPLPSAAFHLCVAFTKNNARNEWLLEKATELGVQHIHPLTATRSEKVHIRQERWQHILTAALIQSQQYHLPVLHAPATPQQVITLLQSVACKLIAHCMQDMPRVPLLQALLPGTHTAVFIGPEGDFTNEELDICTAAGFTGIDLGHHRLRTETAAITVCAVYNLINNA